MDLPNGSGFLAYERRDLADELLICVDCQDFTFAWNSGVNVASKRPPLF